MTMPPSYWLMTEFKRMPHRVVSETSRESFELPLLELTSDLDHQLALLDRLRTPTWIFDIDSSRIYWANTVALEVWRSTDLNELTMRDMKSDMSASVSRRLRQYQEDFERSNATFSELWTIYPGGKPTTLRVKYTGIRLPDGRMAMFCEGLAVVTETPETLRSAEALLHTQMMISLYDDGGALLYQNPAARSTWEAADTSLASRFVDPEDFRQLRRTLVRKGEARTVIRVRTTRGIRWHEITARECRDAVTGSPAFLTSEVDITDLKDTEEKAKFLAYHDVLTGLPNRTAVLRDYSARLEAARAAGEQVAILFVDLDRFKTINDSLGHFVGDEVLIEVAQRLKTVVGRKGLVARLGGDEFLILMNQSGSASRFAAVASGIVEALGEPLRIAGRALVVTPSIGISFFPESGDDIDTLMKSADLAMYKAKEDGRNCFRYFSMNLQEQVQKRMELETDIQRALRDGEFEIFYQPRVAAEDLRIVGAEALIRWNHPTRGVIEPSEFIPLCEETGLIEQVGDWVLGIAVDQQVHWRNMGFPLVVSINLSPRQFKNEDIVSKVAKAIARTGCRPNELELEITESMIMEKDHTVARVVSELTKLGVRLSIDDFGTGYSNLASLQNFPVDSLKIDRSFIENMRSNQAITEMIISLSKLMGMKIVAEGVETFEQLNWLREKGCQEFQGFYFSKPVPAAEFDTLLIPAGKRDRA
ncbi:hypothetical protein GCM10007874_61400 [Labrys miyagiensis]|uniref:Diguanylate cyclase (GGDEF) domain-containing protein n=1 Tax=Labrys miyagiensis TaxID=346912 RepID=A0ABQ6CSP3_9HYPH|nr:hypothetical protein GCM10007874_61400 [Labrys miyagiensis]